MTRSRPDEGDIARRAYEIYESRGATGGTDLDDWLQAERELSGVGISNRESPEQEAQERIENPPFDADSATEEASDPTDRAQPQSSQKSGSRSSARKKAASRYTERTMPAAGPVGGAFGKERD